MVPVVKKININVVYIVLIDYIIICIFGGGGVTHLYLYICLSVGSSVYIFIS